jgi:hypothetical protein
MSFDACRGFLGATALIQARLPQPFAIEDLGS